MVSRLPFTDVLIVDDDKLFTLVHFTRLQRVITAPIKIHYNGKTALEQVTRYSNLHFLILLDLNMPVMNGWEFLEEARRLDLRNLQVVVISSSINTADKTRALSFPHVLEYLEKPLSSEQFFRISEIVDTRPSDLTGL